MTDSKEQRALSALFLLPIVAAAIAFGGAFFILATLAVLILAALEWGNIAMDKPGRLITPAMTMGWALVLLLAQQSVGKYPTILCLIAFLLFWATALIGNRGNRKQNSEGTNKGNGRGGAIWWLTAGSFYLAAAFAAFVWIRQVGGWQPTLWLVITVMATDIASYAGGRHFGGKLLMPKISPKKTYSGLVSGLAASLVVGSIAALLLFDAPQWKLVFVALSLPLGLAASLGDGFESFFKRQFLVKDSGDLIPGHGGVLDVVDSHLTAAVFLAIMISGYA